MKRIRFQAFSVLGGSIAFCLCIFGAPFASAQILTVSFTNTTLGPSSTLQFGDVTVTGDGLPATVTGSGLGMLNGVGPVGEFDREMHFPAGQIPPDLDLGSGTLKLNVIGIIDHVTILPHFRAYSASGALLPLALDFGVLTQSWPGYVDFVTMPAPFGQPLTLKPYGPGLPALDSYMSISIASNWGEFVDYFAAYRQEHKSEEQTFLFGITVQSVTYAAVPEPRSVALLGIACCTLLFRHRWIAGKRSGDQTIVWATTEGTEPPQALV